MAIAFSMNAFEVEEKGKLDHLYLSLPLSRNIIVRGRFTFMIILLVTALVICGIIISVTTPTLQFAMIYIGLEPKIIALLCSFSFLFGGFICFAMYPIMFRVGYTKGKVFGFYIPAIIIAILFGILGFLVGNRMELFLRWLGYWLEHALQVCAIMLGVGAALFIVSYRLSLWLYNKRDL
jgi:hypothetical protein